MTTNEERFRVMLLSGTVTVPPKFPELAEIAFKSVDCRMVIEATQHLSPKTIVKRSFFFEDVTSLFIPANTRAVDLQDGDFYEGAKLEARAMECLDKRTLKGILYVRENAQSLLELTAGLTAAESVEFYPPLPTDRSVNHYQMDADSGVGCPW